LCVQAEQEASPLGAGVPGEVSQRLLMGFGRGGHHGVSVGDRLGPPVLGGGEAGGRPVQVEEADFSRRACSAIRSLRAPPRARGLWPFGVTSLSDPVRRDLSPTGTDLAIFGSS
jgi:hypothetical protein